jgi:glycosyltransferase involved in cell wall biosynthesis
MKVFVTGTRGVPDIPGGIEKHCQELFPRIASRGHNVFLATRSCYVTDKLNQWQGIKLVHCFAPKKKSFEALVHTFIAIIKARFLSPDVVHIHAIGPSLLTPLARILGLTVVVTNHGPEYNRQKWGKLAKFVLKLGEKVGGIFANEVIVISSIIKDIVRRRCHRESNLIYNGIPLPQPSAKTNFLSQIGAEPGRYILAVARFVPEKGLHDLINSFVSTSLDCKLVIAGDADHETQYSISLRKMAEQDTRIILTGYITGEFLNQIYSHARLFVLPSYHEGLPISLLEAVSYGLPVLVSDIPANKEVELPSHCYFRCGDVNDLKEKMELHLKKRGSHLDPQHMISKLAAKYDWDEIADQTIKVYEKAVS